MPYHPLLHQQRMGVERSFFASLHHLAELYGFTPRDVTGITYPLNITLAYEHAKEVLSRQTGNLSLRIYAITGNEVALVTTVPYDTNWTLYYIPVKPIYLLEQQGLSKQVGLLLSICAYLLQVVMVPTFTGGMDYVCGAYASIRQWMDDTETGDGEQNYPEELAEMDQLEKIGEQMMAQMREVAHLQAFERRVKTFRPQSNGDRQLRKIAQAALSLYADYPTQSIFGLIPDRDEELAEDDNYYVTTLDQYLSFYWSSRGALAEQLESYVNCDLENNSAIDEPVNYQVFNSPQAAVFHDQDFCVRLFSLIADLSTFLYELP